MIFRQALSLQLRLVVQLAGLFVVGTALIVGILVYRAYDMAQSLNDRELSLRAAYLARYISPGPDGVPALAMTAALADAYSAGSGADVFAIRGAGNRIIAASPPSFGGIVEHWPEPTDDPGYFHLQSVGDPARDYYGLGLSFDSAVGPLSIWIARAAGADALVRSPLREFVIDIGWIIPVFMMLTLIIGIFAIRSALSPVRNVSEIYSSIGPSTTSLRLPPENLPTEILPLVSAVNRALDRLEQGFVLQRRFTANAAHELRTPLAIVTAALDTMNGDTAVAKLRFDVARMNGLVDQLLSVARLDAVAFDVSEIVDLNLLAREMVGNLAPWALSYKRTVAFAGPQEPVRVQGNAHAIADSRP